jgi:hypothetical protein
MEQLKLLMDYTLFHAGVYITLGGLMVALLGLKSFEDRALKMMPYLYAALGLFLLAGFCAGIIASNIPYHREFGEFTQAWIGPWMATHLVRAQFCMSLEHTAFWAGIAIFLFGFWKSAPPKTGAQAHRPRNGAPV